MYKHSGVAAENNGSEFGCLEPPDSSFFGGSGIALTETMNRGTALS